jgi:hypothetical protein
MPSVINKPLKQLLYMQNLSFSAGRKFGSSVIQLFGSSAVQQVGSSEVRRFGGSQSLTASERTQIYDLLLSNNHYAIM